MKTRFYVIIVILSVMAFFSLLLIQPAVKELGNSIEIGKTLSKYSNEVQQARIEYSYDTSEGYKFYPGGQEKFDEKYNAIMENRNELYNSSNPFTMYFSNLSKIEKIEFLASKAIALVFYIASIAGCILLWMARGIIVLKKKIRKARRKKCLKNKTVLN